jgi:hypothetical protein
MTDREQSRDPIKGKAVHRVAIATVAILMILFGLAEIVTGFTHNFVGVSTTRGAFSAYANAGVGALYSVVGILILSMKKRYVAIALGCLALDVVGRIALVVTGLFPIDAFPANRRHDRRDSHCDHLRILHRVKMETV